VRHREVSVKVTAWVDEGVAALVEALNDLDRVVTIDSCEGGNGKGAHVLFRLRGDRREAAVFASDLAHALGEPGAGYLLQAEWRPGGEGEPMLALTCQPDQVGVVADAVSACRTKLSGGGNPRTALRS
jgi:hypothetical protein